MIKRYIKKALNANQVNKIKIVVNYLKYMHLKIIHNNKLFIRISLFFNNAYAYEHFTFLQGSYMYEKAKRNKKGNIYYLRRNIHRIEKGLLMSPRRKEFGLSFISNTVNSFIKLDNSLNPDIYEWGVDVLKEYFRCTESENEEYLKAKDLFREYVKDSMVEVKCIPYIKKLKSEVTYNAFKTLNMSRKSVRWFEQKAIEKEKIIKALDVARLAPSGCNRQPYRYVITTNKEKAGKIARISGGTGGWSHNIPSIAVVLGRQRSFQNTINRHSIYIDATLTVMPFILALETQGICSCVINWVDIEERIDSMKKEIELNGDECIITSIAMGYPLLNGEVAFSKRMEVDNLVKFI